MDNGDSDDKEEWARVTSEGGGPWGFVKDEDVYTQCYSNPYKGAKSENGINGIKSEKCATWTT